MGVQGPDPACFLIAGSSGTGGGHVSARLLFRAKAAEARRFVPERWGARRPRLPRTQRHARPACLPAQGADPALQHTSREPHRASSACARALTSSQSPPLDWNLHMPDGRTRSPRAIEFAHRSLTSSSSPSSTQEVSCRPPALALHALALSCTC